MKNTITLIMKYFLLLLFVLTPSCYPSDSPPPRATMKDISTQWIGFNEETSLGIGLKINENGKGKLSLSVLNDKAKTLDVDISISNDGDLIITGITESSEKFTLKGHINRQFKLISFDQNIGQLKFRLVLNKKSRIIQKINDLSK